MDLHSCSFVYSLFIEGCVRVGDDVFLWSRKERLCVFEKEERPHVWYQLPCLIIREMGLFAFM